MEKQKEEKKEEGEPRWFLIKHKCGAILTVSSDRFLKNVVFKCPNCSETLMPADRSTAFAELLEKYQNICEKSRKETQTIIMEIQSKDLDFESLPYYLFEE